MECQQRLQVHVSDPVAIGHHETLFGLQQRTEPQQPATGLRIGASVDQIDAPVLHRGVGIVHPATLGVHRDVALSRGVVEDVVLDDLALVPEGKHEIADAVVREAAHDVPQDRHAADFNHGLWLDLGFLAQTGSQTATENDGLHARFLPHHIAN